MGTDILRGRFVVKRNDKYHPISIISSSNTFEYRFGKYIQARDFYSMTERCTLTDDKFVDKDIAIACINEHFDMLKDDEGKISDVYKNFPKTNRGFVNGFFRKELPEEVFTKYKTDPYHFEKYKLTRL